MESSINRNFIISHKELKEKIPNRLSAHYFCLSNGKFILISGIRFDLKDDMYTAKHLRNYLLKKVNFLPAGLADIDLPWLNNYPNLSTACLYNIVKNNQEMKTYLPIEHNPKKLRREFLCSVFIIKNS
jgi:hypothetical protein